MLKNLTQLEHKIGDKVFYFACDINAEIPQVKEALFAFSKTIGAIEDNIKAQQEAQAAQKAKEEADKKAAEEAAKAPEASVIEPLVQEQQA